MKIDKKVSLFIDYVKNQFEYGGKKYAHNDKKESTDCLFDDFGKGWLFGTMSKYCKRWQNLARERDMLKIACYSYILFLKRGFHIDNLRIAPINTTVEVKSKYFPVFVEKAKERLKEALETQEYFQQYHGQIDLTAEYLYKKLKDINKVPFHKIKEENIFDILTHCFLLWNNEIPDNQKGKDQDVKNKTDRK